MWDVWREGVWEGKVGMPDVWGVEERVWKVGRGGVCGVLCCVGLWGKEEGCRVW